MDIGVVNGYKRNSIEIERIIRKHERKKELLNYSTFYGLKKEPEDEEKTRVSIEYVPDITRALRPIYSANNIELVHRSGNNLRQHLGSSKDKVLEIHKSGIYQVKCQEDCDYRYIGRTVRRAKTRFGEHMADWINDDENGSAVAAHLLSHNHEITDDQLSILRPYSDKYKIDYMEAVYINKHREKPLLNKVFGITSPLLTLVDIVKDTARVNGNVNLNCENDQLVSVNNCNKDRPSSLALKIKRGIKNAKHIEANREKGLVLDAVQYKQRVASLPIDRLNCVVCSKGFPTTFRLRRRELDVHLTKEDQNILRNSPADVTEKSSNLEPTICDICNLPFKNMTYHKASHLPPEVITTVEGS
ncbi:hypothetical protein HA402_003357 [Bradysia odoriphaga]|nr:hypothetical protein HA402_003357 [Bradysia odoriphaga]